ncbi:unnamed protein product [Parnassius mnemosyne]|uniref:Breast cancer 2 early onset n=1 Tax=Parnassius mnemosyne TaxID=213953 RepID=A0AAV1KXK6_9NEOP
MDDTQGSRISDAAAAATRKRRSSILKSQRAPRTPLSELEFNVATPTDTAKSRRVSFSRRTGVAEFITNEATTTWKNVYEEQNKSMDSSGNDSAMNPPRQTIGHLGKNIFDQHFQEMEFVDYGGNIMLSSNPRVQEMNISMNINFTQQIAALECEEDDRKLAAPQHFELSSFTDQRSKLFGDEHTIPTIGDMSNKININFSAIEPVGSNNDKCDDLDEIQRDLDRSQPNVVCQGPFRGRNNSEYIEVDLNMTHIGMKNEYSDMSITDTIHSPKVQEVSKSNISVNNGTKSNVNKDWTVDKENIAINPYVSPKESLNFAINEVPDQILVFDGRKLTIQPENNDIFNKDNDEQHFRKTLLPNNSSERPTQRKTIILNVNDDLPNFIDDVSLLGQVHGLSISRDVTDQKNSINNQGENRITSTVINDNDEIANISVTQAIPTDILLEKQKEKDEKRQTIFFENDNGNLSMTQLVPTNYDVCTKETTNNKTVVYDGDNISFTQALPSNMLLSEKTNFFCQNSTLPTQNDLHMSLTQAVPNNMLLSSKFTQSNKRNTILYGDDTGDISITRVLPTNILMVENRNDINSATITTVDQSLEKNNSKNTIIYEKDSCNISMTETIPKNIIISNISTADKTKTTYYDKDQGNISETQVIPTTLVDFEIEIKKDVKELEDNQSFNKSKFVHDEKQRTNMSMTEAVTENILNASNVCDISVTQALPSNIIISDQEKYCNQGFAKEKSVEMKNTIVETVPENIILQNDILGSNTNAATRETESGNMLHLNSLALNISNTERKEATERKSFKNNLIETTHEGSPEDSFISESYKTRLDMSLTQLLHQNDVSLRTNIISDKRKTIVNGDNLSNIPVTQVITTKNLLNEIEFKSGNATQTDDGRNNEVLNNEFTESANMVTEYTQQNQHNISSCKASINPHSDISMYKEKAHNSTKQEDIVTNNQLCNHSFVSKTKQDILEHSKVISEKSEIESDGNNKGNDTINKTSANLLKQKEISQTSNNAVESLSYIQPKSETKINKSATEHNHQDLFVYQAVTTHNVSRHQNMEVERNDSRMDETLNESIERPTRISSNPNQSDGNLLNISKLQLTELENKEMSLDMSVNAVLKYDTSHQTEKPRNSILNELLNMSSKSLCESVDGIDDKHLMVKRGSQFDQIPEYFHKTQEAGLELSESIECKENKPEDSLLKENVLELKNLIYEPEKQNSAQTKRHFENVLSSNPDQVNFKENKNRTINESVNEIDSKKLQNSYRNRTFKTADDTNELLEMLSDFTDRTIAKETKEDEDKPSVNVNNVTALEDRTDCNEFKRTSLAKSRLSIMLSREDLLNNISMAHAVLQQAMTDMNESESINETHCETPVEQSDEIMDDANTARNLVRVSTEVVKKLQFDDSINEIKSKSDINLSPLKKTAFNDTSNLIESKAKVIPSYLSEVSDDIKSLMHDLVKPMADVIPFETSRLDEMTKNDPSTCSIQIQANIITSSQIDIDIESYPDSECDVAKTQANKGFDYNLKHADPTAAGLPAESLKNIPSTDGNKQTHIQHLQKQRVPEQILVFDHTNPLNNVVLSPAGQTDIHRYSPSKSSELIYEVKTDKSPQNSPIGNSVEEELNGQKISTYYNIITSATDCKPELTGSGSQSGDLSNERVENNSIVLVNSKPASADNSTNDIKTHIKDTEVNTLIVMKSNKELLEASSSLTLVNDDEQNVIEIEDDIGTTKSDLKNERNSPVKMIFKITDQDIQNFPSSVDLGDAENNTKAKKRIYSPAKSDQLKKVTLLSPEVTPKPLSKMQKLSDSPGRLKNASNRSSTAKPSKAEIENASKGSEKSLNISTTKKQTKSQKKSISNSKHKLEATVIVQHVTVECKIDAESKVKARETAEDMESESSSSSTLKSITVSQKEIKECLSPEMACSFTSSKAMKEIQCMPSVTTTISAEANSTSSDTSRLNWQTEDVNERGSKKLVLESESSENVLPKINMLLFIRSCECEWEYADLYTWQFMLMRRRLRLTLKLDHVHSNTPAHICVETPVLSTTVDVAHEDADTLSTTCVRLACEAMRYECGRGVKRADDAGALLRRCAGVARVARRWATAMLHVRLHLAYKLAHDGTLSLHVANIPLRCVWEVTMRLELVIEDARQAAWPRAGHVHVRDVTHGHDVTKVKEDVERLLARVPHDWGHVPKTIWKVFRYLKNKTEDNELLGI